MKCELCGLGYMEETEEGRELWSKIDRLQGKIEGLKMEQEQIRKKIFRMKPKKNEMIEKKEPNSWKGRKMMNPKGKIGVVVEDENLGYYRYLTIKFEDGTKETLKLNNVSNNPIKSRKWKWLYKTEWEEWGE